MKTLLGDRTRTVDTLNQMVQDMWSSQDSGTLIVLLMKWALGEPPTNISSTVNSFSTVHHVHCGGEDYAFVSKGGGMKEDRNHNARVLAEFREKAYDMPKPELVARARDSSEPAGDTSGHAIRLD